MSASRMLSAPVISCTALAPRIEGVARFAVWRLSASLVVMADGPSWLRTCAAALGLRRSLGAAKMVNALNRALLN